MQEWPQGTPRNEALTGVSRARRGAPPSRPCGLSRCEAPGRAPRYVGRCGLETDAPCLAYCSAVTLFQFVMILSKDPTFPFFTGRCKLRSWASLTEIRRVPELAP